MSVNQAWKGRRFKTNEYKVYENSVYHLLPSNIEIPEKIAIYLEFGVSSRGFDWDNPIKPFMDILQKKYIFNDNRIYSAVIKKTIVEKGKEYIAFKFEELS